MMVWLLPRYLLRLWKSKGWGVWIRGEALFLVSRKKPILLCEIDHVRLRKEVLTYVVTDLRDGQSVSIPVWGMNIDPDDLATQIDDARLAATKPISSVS